MADLPLVSDPVLFIPPLEQGDHLTRAEFERRYQAMPHVTKAELIEGVVHMPSPVRIGKHAEPHAELVGFYFSYRVYTSGVRVADNSTVRLDLDNEPQPDGLLFIDPAHGGNAKISDDDYLEKAPELVGEIAASSVSIDLNTKFRVYRRNGVQEYMVWRVQDRMIDWFRWQEGEYKTIQPGEDGILRSVVFPGLWLDPQALVNQDLPKLMTVLQQGLASPEHTAFVQALQAKKQS